MALTQEERSARSYNRARSAVLEVLGGVCVRCGFDDPRALQIDHVNGGGKADRRCRGSRKLYSAIVAGEPGFQLLCANCNTIKRVENGEHRGR